MASEEGFRSNLLEWSYRGWDEMEILNELQAPVSILDCEAGTAGLLWANKAFLEIAGTSIEDIEEMDISAFGNQIDMIYKKVQNGGDMCYSEDFLLGSKFSNATTTWRPLRIFLPGDRQERVMVLGLSAQRSDGEQAVALTPAKEPIQPQPSGGFGSFSDFMNSSGMITMVFDAVSEKCLYENEAARQHYATSAKSILDILNACTWTDSRAKRELYTQIKSAASRIELECKKNIGPNGVEEEVWHRVVFDPVERGSAEPAILVTEVDISALKRAERTLQRHEEAQEHFFAAMSHDLRTPLNGIIGLSDTLIQSPGLAPMMQKTLKVINTSGRRLANLLNNVLDAGSSNRSALTIKHEQVSLAPLVESVCDALNPLLTSALALEKDIAPQLPTIEADAERLRQIVTSVLGNAIKYTPSGTIALSVQPREDYVEIAVRDSGPGIAATRLDHVLAAFAQADVRATRRTGGIGLGLTLVKALVAAHNGTLDLRSATEGPGHGTTVTVRLPMTQPPDDPKQQHPLLRASEQDASSLSVEKLSANGAEGRARDRTPSIAEEVQLVPGRVRAVEERTTRRADLHDRITDLTEVLEMKGKKLTRMGHGSTSLKHHSELHGATEILSVDDNMVNHLVVENSLQPKGYTVTKCMSGVDALKLMESRQYLPDLILLDALMPHMSAYEMVEQLRLKYPYNVLPVIMVSAKKSEADVAQRLSAGCNDFLAKPYGSEELNARIDNQLNRQFLWGVRMQQWMADRSPAVQLPDKVQLKLRRGEDSVVHVNEHAVVLVCEVADMGRYAQQLTARELARIVDGIYDTFDEIARNTGATRVLDELYMLVLEADPVESCDEEEQAQKMLRIAAEMLEAMNTISFECAGMVQNPQVKIGIAFGQAYCALVGVKHTYVTYFGQAVREACTCCTQGFPQCIVTTRTVYALQGPRKAQMSHLASFSVKRAKTEVITTYVANVGAFEVALQKAQDDVIERKWIAGAGRDPDDFVRKDSSGQGLLRLAPRLDALKEAHSDGEDSETGTESHPQSLPVQRRKILKESGSRASIGSCSAKACVNCAVQEQTICELQDRVQELMLAQTQRRVDQEEPSGLELGLVKSSTTLPSFSEVHGAVQVLSVDDDPANQLVVENMLGEAGYEVVCSMNGVEALELLQRSDTLPDIVLLDVTMPLMSGIEVCAKLRATYSRCRLPIIMVCAKAAEGNIVEGLEAGATDYVAKPFQRPELLARIATQLELVRAWRAELKAFTANSFLKTLIPAHVVPMPGADIDARWRVETHAAVSVLCCNVMAVPDVARKIRGRSLLSAINRVHHIFDEFCLRHRCFKLEAMGNGLMAVAFQSEDAGHVSAIISLALDLLGAVPEIDIPDAPDHRLEVRVGVHSGAALSAVVGWRLPRFTLLGETTYIATQLEESGCSMCVHASDSFKQRAAGYAFESCGRRALAGREQPTWLLKDDRCKWESALETNASGERACQAAVLCSLETAGSDAMVAAQPHAGASAATPHLERQTSHRQHSTSTSITAAAAAAARDTDTARRGGAATSKPPAAAEAVSSQEEEKERQQTDSVRKRYAASRGVQTDKLTPALDDRDRTAGSAQWQTEEETARGAAAGQQEREGCARCEERKERERASRGREKEAQAALGKLRSEHATLLATCSSLMSSHANATPPQPWPQQPDPPQQQQHPAGATPQSAGAWSPAYAFRASAEGTMGAQSQGVSSVLVSTLMQREALNERILSNFMQRDALNAALLVKLSHHPSVSQSMSPIAPPNATHQGTMIISPRRQAPASSLS